MTQDSDVSVTDAAGVVNPMALQGVFGVAPQPGEMIGIVDHNAVVRGRNSHQAAVGRIKPMGWRIPSVCSSFF